MLESVYRTFYANVRWPPGPGPGPGAATSYPNISWVIPIYETYTGISQDILTCPRVVFSDVTWLRLNSEVNSLPVSSAASLRLPVNIHWDGLRLGCQWAESNPSSCLQARARAYLPGLVPYRHGPVPADAACIFKFTKKITVRVFCRDSIN